MTVSRLSLRKYYRLTKPGIIYGNVLTGAAGYLFASKWHINFVHFASTLLGMSLVIGSACTFNNVFDRNLDKKMNRTKNRALARGEISVIRACFFAVVIGLVGFLVLKFEVNLLVVWLGVIGFLDYITIYTWSKRKTIHSTLIGSISGAIPITAGYVAYTAALDRDALLLFLIMVFWQMPHFYAISTYRSEDYLSADMPVLITSKGLGLTRQYIMLYILAFTISVMALGYAGNLRLFVPVMGTVCVAWLLIGVKSFWSHDTVGWAKQAFFSSLAVLLSFSVILSLSVL